MNLCLWVNQPFTVASGKYHVKVQKPQKRGYPPPPKKKKKKLIFLAPKKMVPPKKTRCQKKGHTHTKKKKKKKLLGSKPPPPPPPPKKKKKKAGHSMFGWGRGVPELHDAAQGRRLPQPRLHRPRDLKGARRAAGDSRCSSTWAASAPRRKGSTKKNWPGASKYPKGDLDVQPRSGKYIITCNHGDNLGSVPL